MHQIGLLQSIDKHEANSPFFTPKLLLSLSLGEMFSEEMRWDEGDSRMKNWLDFFFLSFFFLFFWGSPEPCKVKNVRAPSWDRLRRRDGGDGGGGGWRAVERKGCEKGSEFLKSAAWSSLSASLNLIRFCVLQRVSQRQPCETCSVARHLLQLWAKPKIN